MRSRGPHPARSALFLTTMGAVGGVRWRHLPAVQGLRHVRQPGQDPVQIAQMPDGRSYMWVARMERRASRYGQLGKTFAIGLGCELRHAHRLVYAEGLDLSGEAATPIGVGCRVGERDNCPQRAFPAPGRALDLDEHHSTVSAYLVKRP